MGIQKAEKVLFVKKTFGNQRKKCP